MRFALVPLAAVALAAPAGSLAAAEADLVVRADNRIDDFRVKADGTLGGAVAALGRPSRVVRTSAVSCRVSWRRLGVRMGFYNLGGLNPCGRRTGHFSNAVLRGSRWRTGLGLRIGDPVCRLRALYPNAKYKRDGNGGSGWWLVVRTSPFGTGGTYPGLLARSRDGVVTAFVVRYPAGGD
jgi:hypothetical protein